MATRVNIKSIFYTLLSFFLGISFVMRSKPTLVYFSPIVEYIIIFALLIICFLIYVSNKKKKRVELHEILYILLPLFFIGTPLNKYIIFYFVGLLFYFIIQEDPKYAKYFLYPAVIFAIFTAIVSWIATLYPDFYVSKILTIFDESKELSYSFFTKGMNHGFTTHYSRNSLYITIGVLILFCKTITPNIKNKRINYILILFLISSQFLVGKRGLSIFMFVTMFFLIMIKEKKIASKISKLMKYLIPLAFFLFLGYIFIPSISNIFTRFITMLHSDDVSNGRFQLYKIAWNMFIAHPILGCGWGSFLLMVQNTTFQAVHNDYLQALAEIGIVGVFIMFIPNYLSMIKSTKYYKKTIGLNEVKEPNNYNYLLLVFISIQLFLLLYSLTGFPHFSYEQVLLYFVSCGVTSGIRKNDLLRKKSGDI